MAEKNGTIVSYNPTNRLGEIIPEGTQLRCRFYLTTVSNAEPLPKAGDKVSFEAPEPRKNKSGKLVQSDATAVTVVERGASGKPLPPRTDERREARRGKGRGPDSTKPLWAQRGPDDRKGRERRGGTRGEKSERRGQSGSRSPGGERSPGMGASRGAPVGGERRRAGEARAPLRGSAGRGVPGGRVSGGRGFNRRGPGGRSGGQPAHVGSTFPLSAEFSPLNLQNPGFNPGLILDKFIGWPAPATSLGRSAGGVAGGPTHRRWHLSERNKSFFLRNFVLEPLRQSFQRVLPHDALHTRRESLLTSLQTVGHVVWKRTLGSTSKLALGSVHPSMLGGLSMPLARTLPHPFIPAESIRGLMRSYLRALANSGDVPAEQEAQQLLSVLFGSKDSPGALMVFDAIPLEREIPITIDVQASHFGPWYRGDEAPSDDHSVEERFFLVVRAGTTFSFALAVSFHQLSRDLNAEELLAKAGAVLTRALREWGVGAKTASGYGRFELQRAKKPAKPRRKNRIRPRANPLKARGPLPGGEPIKGPTTPQVEVPAVAVGGSTDAPPPPSGVDAG